MDPRQRARRNLVIFWIAATALPIVIVRGGVTFRITLSNMA